MFRYLAVIGFAAAVGLANLPQAFAQENALKNDERAYCNQLAAKYERYMPMRSYGESRGGSPSVDTMVALTMCNDGRAADAIPTLERTLRGAGFNLPERAVGARP